MSHQLTTSYHQLYTSHPSDFQFPDGFLQDCTMVEISEMDNFFDMILNYISSKGRPSHFSVTQHCEKAHIGTGLGLHSINHKGFDIFVCCFVLGEPLMSLSKACVHHVLTLAVRGKENVMIIKDFCEVVSKEYNKQKNNFSIYSYKINRGVWKKTATKDRRGIETVVLPESLKNDLINDINDFIAQETLEWYRFHGLTYKRSYLLYGPPGSGKSSFIQATAGLTNRNIYFLQPSHPKFTDDTLRSAISQADSKSIIVLEDIDALFDKDRNNQSSTSPLTFSGLLNALDGVPSVEGHIFFLTSNFIEKLDFALIRDGRVDLRVEFPAATREQMVNMFTNFYPGEDVIANEFADCVSREMGSISMATLQNHFIKHRKSNANTAKMFVKPSN